MTELALSGVRVADFSWVWAGPLCTRYLASMGAEVIKIESRKKPDGFRLGGGKDAEGNPLLNQAPNFNLLAYSKKSVSLDLSRPEGIEWAKRLVAISDLVVENYGTGAMERMGLGYEELRKIRPDVILVSSSGFGRTGPEAGYVAYGNTIQAYSGINAVTGYRGEPPRGIGSAFSDPLTGTTEILGVLAALYHRHLTGEGQHVDLSMVEATVSHLPEAVMDYILNGRERGPQGNDDDACAPHGVYRCRGDDAWIAIAVQDEEEWGALRCALGEPAWAAEPRFADAASRVCNRQLLDQHIEEWTRNLDRVEAMEILQEAGVPAGPVYNARDVAEDAHMRERGLFVELDHPELGPKLYVGHPWKLLPDDNARYERPPLLGEHSEYVLKELLGASDSEFDRLVNERVLY